MKVYRNFKGRLGNQFFQYASAYAIMRDNEISSNLYASFKSVYDNNFSNDLKHFNISNITEINKVKLNIFQKVLMFYIVFVEKIFSFFYKGTTFEICRHKFEINHKRLFNRFGLIRLVDGYSSFKVKKNSNLFISGTMESAKYFDKYRDDILKMFTPRYAPLEKNKYIYEAAKDENSVCISIRRGDFLDPKFSKKHFVCNEDYFRKAIKIMNEKLDDPKYIIFSDDIEWCKENITFLKNVIFEDGTDPVWEKIRMMYSCSNFILSNSTFSWWAQYLSRNDRKIVLAPKKWKNEGLYDDIYQDYMILI